jgi:signal transduction histidine kinase
MAVARLVALAEGARPTGRVELRDILDTPREPAFDRLTRLVARSLNAPVSLLTFVDAQRQWFKSSYGLSAVWDARRETPLSHSFCQYVVRFKKPLIVTDARCDPLVQENLAIPELGIAAYLGVPLFEEDGTVLGSLSVADGKTRSWTEADVSLLQDFAAIAMIELRLRVEMVNRHEAEDSLRQAQKLNALGQLSSGIAHDFKNILLGVRGYVDLLAEEAKLTEPFAGYVRELRKSTDRASALVSQLLSVGRKESRAAQRISLNRVIQEMEPMLRCTLGEQVRFELSLDDSLADVEVDLTQLQRLILNLIVNARDATPPNGLIRLSTREYSKDQSGHNGADDRSVELTVQDSGCGMDEKTLEHIFEPFFSTKSSAEGTGLGLFSVYGIVQQIGGRIEVDSEVGKGSQFRIRLPALHSRAS